MRAKPPLLLAMAALLLLAVIAAHGGSAVPHGHGVLSLPTPPVNGLSTIDRRTTVPENPALTVSLSLAVLIVLLASFAGVVVLLGSRCVFRRRRLRGGRIVADHDEPDADPAGEAARVLLRGARNAQLVLRQRGGGPPADAVQRAWLALESAAADSGAARRAEQTPTEFTSALLAEHRVAPDAVATLLARYHRARFGRPDTVTEADAAVAATALDRIISDLAEAEPV